MANTTTNTSKNKFDNIKNVRVNVTEAAKRIKDALAEIHSKYDKLSSEIQAMQKTYTKHREDAEQAVAQQNSSATVEQVAKQPAIASQQPKVDSVVAEKSTDKQSATTDKEKTSAPKAAKADNANTAQNGENNTSTDTNADKPIKENGVKVESKVEGGKKIKIYTDESGNVSVRKFWDPNAQKSTPASTQRNTRPQSGARNNANSAPRQNDRRTNTNNEQDRRNTSQKPAMPKHSQSSFAPINLPRAQEQKSFGNKNKTHERSDEKRTLNKKSLMTRNYAEQDYDEDRVVRRAKTKKEHAKATVEVQKITHAVVSTVDVPIKTLSERIGISVSEIIKQLFKENIFKTINDSIEFDYAAYIAGMYGVTLELKAEKTAEEILAAEAENDTLENDTNRPPIVTVMGHVDHGKTSLLDAIRNTNVTKGEAGGITQHIGAYTVTVNSETITFIDTPGHAAFTAMRARGAKITDVAIIVVAADDGVMPQTIEAINHAKAADVSIVVAINKMDKTDVNVDRVLQQLAEHELLCEQWGGDIIAVPVSAKTGMGLDKLLESVLLVTEIKELKANPKKRATGTVLESRLDKGRGVVATILVSNGTLNVGDNIIAGLATGKIRAMFDDKGKRVKSAGPSMPVEVLGFSEVPDAGDFMYVADEKLVRKAAEERKNKIKIETAKQAPSMNLGDLFGRISEGQLKALNLIIKTDVQGSLEALRSSLEKISNNEVKVCSIHGGVGAINESDVMLARASQAIIIGFNVRADSNAKIVAERENVDIRLYNVIYDAVDDVTAAMKGMLAPKFRETVTGTVEVREVFKISGVGTVAGAYVTSGKAVRNGKVRIYRNDVSIYDGNILALKRFKDDVKEVAAGYECGISVENYNDIKVGDVFEVYQMEEIKQ